MVMWLWRGWCCRLSVCGHGEQLIRRILVRSASRAKSSPFEDRIAEVQGGKAAAFGRTISALVADFSRALTCSLSFQINSVATVIGTCCSKHRSTLVFMGVDR